MFIRTQCPACQMCTIPGSQVHPEATNACQYLFRKKAKHTLLAHLEHPPSNKEACLQKKKNNMLI